MSKQTDPKQLVGELVFPILIPTPFAVGDVYSYLIRDEKLVLVDCGQKEERAFDRITEVLKDQGLAVRDLDEIWLTHGHPDHFGQAARLADMSGADIFGHSKERANFAGNDDRELFVNFFDYHAIPDELTETMVEQIDWLQQYQEAVEPGWIEEGDRLSSGRLNFDIKFTPGHAPGHLMFREDSGLIFGGDVLLGHISTNALINFDPDTGKRNRSLLQYRESLQWVSKQQGYILPGHGQFIEHISETANHHLKEHETRYSAIKTLLKRQPLSLFELAAKTFPEPMKKGAVFLVLSEVLGYLDWGSEKSEIEKVEEKDSIKYRSSV